MSVRRKKITAGKRKVHLGNQDEQYSKHVFNISKGRVRQQFIYCSKILHLPKGSASTLIFKISEVFLLL